VNFLFFLTEIPKSGGLSLFFIRGSHPAVPVTAYRRHCLGPIQEASLSGHWRRCSGGSLPQLFRYQAFLSEEKDPQTLTSAILAHQKAQRYRSWFWLCLAFWLNGTTPSAKDTLAAKLIVRPSSNQHTESCLALASSASTRISEGYSIHTRSRVMLASTQ
jgi:hypothetical protein